MAATSNAAPGSTAASVPTVMLNFEVIDARAGEILGLAGGSVLTDQMLADLLHLDQSTISRWRKGRTKPGLDTALDMAAVLKLPVERFSVRIKAGE
jgi:DNA-binding XRE family transcriptional regulator